MELVWIILLAILAGYLIFIVGPVIVSFFCVFGQQETVYPWVKPDPAERDWLPYLDRLQAEAEIMEKRPVKRFTCYKGKLELAADYYSAGSRNTLILCHGFNARPLTNFGAIANEYLAKGYNILLPYSRAHTPSRGGRPSLGILEEEDLRDWIEYLFAHTNTKKVLLWGVSMGAATIAFASDKLESARVKGMILDCAPESLYRQYARDSEQRRLPWPLMLPAARLIGLCAYHKDIKATVHKSLERTTIPALFLHGERDLTVPIAVGRANFESCVSKKEFIAVPDAAHALSYEKLREAGDTRIDRFIEACFNDDTEA